MTDDLVAYGLLFIAGVLGVYYLLGARRHLPLLLYPAAVPFIGLDDFLSPFKIISVLCFVGLILLLAARRFAVRWPAEATLLVCGQVFAIGSYAANSGNPSETLRISLSRVMLALMPIVLLNLLQSEKSLERLVIIGSIASVIGVGIASLSSEYLLGNSYRLGDTLGKRSGDGIATLAIINLPILLYAGFRARSMIQRLLWASAGTILIVGIVLSSSRMALLLIVAFSAWMISRTPGAMRKTAVMLLVCVAIILTVGLNEMLTSGTDLSLERLIDSLPIIGDNSQELRTRMRWSYVYPAAIQIISEHPYWGVGLQGFDSYARDASPDLKTMDFLNTNPVYPHNLILEILAEQGVFVAIFTLSAVVVALKHLWQAARLSRKEIRNRGSALTLFHALYISAILLILSSMVRDAFNDKFIYFMIAYGMYASYYVKSLKAPTATSWPMALSAEVR